MAGGGEPMSPDFENAPDMSENRHEQQNDYLQRAAQAFAAGDDVLAVHLYLAAFEQADYVRFLVLVYTVGEVCSYHVSVQH